MEKERTLTTKRIFEGRAVQLRVDTIKRSDGKIATREIIEHSDCVAIIAVDRNDDVFLVRQYRHATNRELLEIPAGGIEMGETPSDSVCRELREETGYSPGHLEKIGGFYSTPGYCTEYLHLYLATELEYNPLCAEDTSEIQLIRIPLSQIEELITSGQICDAKSIAGLCAFLVRIRGKTF